MRGTTSKSATPPSSPSTRSSTRSTSSSFKKLAKVGLALIPSSGSLVAAGDVHALLPEQTPSKKRRRTFGSNKAVLDQLWRGLTGADSSNTRPSGTIDLEKQIYSVMVNESFSSQADYEPNSDVNSSNESTQTVAGKLREILFEQEKEDWVIDSRTECLLEAVRAPPKKRHASIREYVKGLYDVVDDSRTNRSTDLESRRESPHVLLQKPLNDLLRIKLLTDVAEAFPRIYCIKSDGEKESFDAKAMRSLLHDICKESKPFDAFMRAIDTTGTFSNEVDRLPPAYSSTESGLSNQLPERQRPPSVADPYSVKKRSATYRPLMLPTPANPPPSANGGKGPCISSPVELPVCTAKKAAVRKKDTQESFIENLTSIEKSQHKVLADVVARAQALSTDHPNALKVLRASLRDRCEEQVWAPEGRETSIFLGSRWAKWKSAGRYLKSINKACKVRKDGKAQHPTRFKELLGDIYCLDYMASSRGCISGDTSADISTSTSTSTSVCVSTAEALDGYAKRNHCPWKKGDSLLYSLYELYYNSPIVLAYMLALNSDRPEFKERIEDWYQLRKKASVEGKLQVPDRRFGNVSALFAPMDLWKLGDLELARFLFVIPSESQRVIDLEDEKKTVANMENSEFSPQTAKLLFTFAERGEEARKNRLPAVSEFVSDFEANLALARDGKDPRSTKALQDVADSLKVFRVLLHRIETEYSPFHIQKQYDGHPPIVMKLTAEYMLLALRSVCEKQADLRSAISELSTDKDWVMLMWRTRGYSIKAAQSQKKRRMKVKQMNAQRQRSFSSFYKFTSDIPDANTGSLPSNPGINQSQRGLRPPPTSTAKPSMAEIPAVRPPIKTPVSAPPEESARYSFINLFPGGFNGGPLPPGNAP